MKRQAGGGRSAFLPLHEGLIVTTDGEQVSVSGAEKDAGDVLGVTTERSGDTSLEAGVVEEADKTVIVTGGKEHLVIGTADGVDMGAIGASGVDTLGLPEELAGHGGPLSVLEVGAAGRILLAVFSGEEEELVSTTVGSEELGVSAPVEGHDVRAVTLAFSTERPVSSVVDVDGVVVGTDSEVSAIRGEGHNLDPLGGVAEKGEINGGVGVSGNADSTVVTGNGDEVGVDSDAARALGVWELGEGGSTASLGLLTAVGDLHRLHKGAGCGIPHHDLVVITGGDDLTASSAGKTPDLTIGVGGHDGLLVAACVRGHDGTVTETNDKFALIVDINSADGGREFDGGLDSHGAGVPAVDHTVLGAGVELAVGESETADETLVGAIDGLLTGATIVATPDVNITVGATSVSLAIVVPSGTGEGGLVEGAEKTSLLVAGR